MKPKVVFRHFIFFNMSAKKPSFCLVHFRLGKHIPKFDKIAKSGCEMLQTKENIHVAWRSSRIWCINVLRTKKPTTFEAKLGETARGYILILQHFATKLGNFTHFEILFVLPGSKFILCKLPSPLGDSLQFSKIYRCLTVWHD